MSQSKWIRAKKIKVGNIVCLDRHELEVSKVELSKDKVNITTKIGHNGIQGQKYSLEPWQEVEVKDIEQSQ